MALSKIIAESMDLTDTFNFTGTLQQNGSSIGGVNTPCFHATMSADQTLSDNTATKVTFNTEKFDVGSCYDHSSNFRFTVPSGEAGKYLITVNLGIKSYDDTYHIEGFVKLYKNGSNSRSRYQNFSGNYINQHNYQIQELMNLSEADYIEVYGQCNVTTNSPQIKGGYSNFQACKIIE